MALQNQELIDSVITRIAQAEAEGSVTNDMVAAVLDFLNKSLAILSNKVDKLPTTAPGDGSGGTVDTSGIERRLDTLESKLAQPEGIATLDDNGRLPVEQLPAEACDVVEFSGCALLAMVPAPEHMSYIGTDGEVLYFSTAGVFMLRVGMKYYANWGGADRFGTSTAAGRTPLVGKIYVDTSTGLQYRWDGEQLVTFASPLALGTTEGTAYDGAAGAKLRTDLDAEVDMRRRQVSELEKGISTARAEARRIVPFDGIVADEAALAAKGEGIYFVLDVERFGNAHEPGLYGFQGCDDYNRHPDSEAHEDRLFICGPVLYRYLGGEGLLSIPDTSDVETIVERKLAELLAAKGGEA